MKKKIILLKTLIHLAALIPLIYTYYLAFSDKLGGDPVEAILHFTGIGSLNILLITLCVSPMAKKFKQGFILNTRRLVGLYAFFYALCHLLSFIAFEVQFDMRLFIEEVFKRPYMLIGMLSFILLLLLTLTSINRIRQSMGKKWQSLHNTIYLIAPLVVWHFYWSVKSEITSPLFYALVVVVLLSLRTEKLKRIFNLNKKIR